MTSTDALASSCIDTRPVDLARISHRSTRGADGPLELIGSSPVLEAVLHRAAKVARTDSTVLITGETGTGKELLARALHRWSRRSDGPFVSVNCASMPSTLIASELFGHEKGAYTGALQRRIGRFELAHGGTLFLDEVGELPEETQVALLRVVQEREFDRVGGVQTIRVDVRIVAATNRNLEQDVADSSFRSDLYYRLNVFPLEMPPLRERDADIQLLLESFVDLYSRRFGKTFHGISDETRRLVSAYRWPGNVRELQNVVERSVIVCESMQFSLDESWARRISARSASSPASPTRADILTLQEVERAAIERALESCGGMVGGPNGAAARLGMKRTTLQARMKKLDIDVEISRRCRIRSA